MMAQELMYVFLAVSFDNQGRERAQYLAEFLAHFGVHCVLGENFGGDGISKGVKSRITKSSFVIGIFSRANKINEDIWEASQWVRQEVDYADALSKPFLLLMEDGVRFSAGLLGDIEYISFNAANFSEVLPRVLCQVKAILNSRGLTIGIKEADPVMLYVPKRRPGPKKNKSEALHESVLKLIDEEEYKEAFELATKLTAMHPNYWGGWISLGALFVKQWNLVEGGAIFARVAKKFRDVNEAVAAAYHNCAWVLELKSGPNPSLKSLLEQARLYNRALAKEPSRVYTRAALICTYLLLNEREVALALLDESAIYGEEFIEALRQELKSRGTLRLKILCQLPTLVQNLLDPIPLIHRGHMEPTRRDVRVALNQPKGVQREQEHIFKDEEFYSPASALSATRQRRPRRRDGCYTQTIKSRRKQATKTSRRIAA